jgi:hypothetical protein
LTDLQTVQPNNACGSILVRPLECRGQPGLRPRPQVIFVRCLTVEKVDAHATPFRVAQQVGPALARFPIAVGEGLSSPRRMST